MGGPKAASAAKKAEKAASAAKKAEKRRPFVLEHVVVDPGTTDRVDLRVARLPTGVFASMPVVVVHGQRPGPTVWINGAIHGDELNGIGVVRQVVASLDPQKLAGTVLGVPIVNVFGVPVGSRYLPDRRDLNRCFPGAARGSLAGRLAYRFFESVVSQCDYGIDFHTGSAGRTNLPHLRCRIDDETELRLARAYGPPLVLDTAVKPGTLRAACHKAGIPVLLCEAGEAGRLGGDAIESGVTGTMRVLRELGMLDPLPKGKRPPAPVLCGSSDWLRAGRSGFAVMQVPLGARIEKGQPVATVFDAVGSTEHVVHARFPGIVVGALRTAIVHRGDAILHVARPA